MVNGSYQQLSAKGIQNTHLDIDPEFSFWKRSYRRHAAFAIEANESDMVNASWGKTPKCQIDRKGDFVMKMYAMFDLELLQLEDETGLDSVFWCNCLGHNAFTVAECVIGQIIVDKLFGEQLEIQHERENPAEIDIDELVYRANSHAQLKKWSKFGNTLNLAGDPISRLYVNLPFWFTKANSQCLPLIALQYHEVNIKLNLRAKKDLLIFTNENNKVLHNKNNGDIRDLKIFTEIVFVDTDERTALVESEHEYVVTNIQESIFNKNEGDTSLTAHIDPNHPIIEHEFVVVKHSNLDANDYFNWERTDGQGDDSIVSFQLLLNSSERERKQDALFHRIMHTAWFYKKTPSRPNYCYSFALEPAAWYPTGTVNSSRIDKYDGAFTFPSKDGNGVEYGKAEVHMYSKNFNFFKIKNGMGSVAYAN
jgi:hypothetical protein